MKIVIFTIGTRGDVEPFVAFGTGLKASGHEVTVATHAMFENFVTEQGLVFTLISGNVLEAINSEGAQKALDKKQNTFAFFMQLKKEASPLVVKAVKEASEAFVGAEHIVCTPLTLHMTFFLTQKMNIPLTLGSVNPVGSTKYFHNLLFPPPSSWLPKSAQTKYNTTSHSIVDSLVWKAQRPLLNKAWKEIFGEELPSADPLKPTFTVKPPLILNAYSQYVLDKPTDWGPTQHVTGYWFLPVVKNWEAPKELEAFIDAGEKPFYIGFGSMNNSGLKDGALKKLILETIERTGIRAVVYNQGLGITKQEAGSNIFTTGAVPFEYLFPKMRAVVHHGGAGTTAAGFRAGVPNIITPLINDQRFWSWRVSQLVVGPKAIPWNSLTVDNLTEAINTTLNDHAMQQKAYQLGVQVRTENGVEKAVRLFNGMLPYHAGKISLMEYLSTEKGN